MPGARVYSPAQKEHAPSDNRYNSPSIKTSSLDTTPTGSIFVLSCYVLHPVLLIRRYHIIRCYIETGNHNFTL